MISWLHSTIEYLIPWHQFVCFLKIFFWIWTILKVLIEFVGILLLFYVWFFGRESCGILVSQPGIHPILPALEGEVLTAGPLGKSLDVSLNLADDETFR